MIIVKDLPKLQCIYKIYNVLEPSKFYVGSIDNLQRRLRTHLNEIDRRKHCNKKLENSFYKNGKENFKLQILQFCKNVDKQRLLEIEQYWLDLLKPYYNLSIKATCTIASEEGVKIRTAKLRFKSNNKKSIYISVANVDFHKASNLFRVRIRYNNIDMYFGGFHSLEEAELHRNNLISNNTAEELYILYSSKLKQKQDVKQKKIVNKLKNKELAYSKYLEKQEIKIIKEQISFIFKTSNYNHVSYDSVRHKYLTQFKYKKKYYYVGYFLTEQEAATAYNKLVTDNNIDKPLLTI